DAFIISAAAVFVSILTIWWGTFYVYWKAAQEKKIKATIPEDFFCQTQYSRITHNLTQRAMRLSCSSIVSVGNPFNGWLLWNFNARPLIYRCLNHAANRFH